MRGRPCGRAAATTGASAYPRAVEFTLAHGTGNDFVVVVDRDGAGPLRPSLVRALCDRRTGLGADGVIRLVPGGADGDPPADVTMDHVNADGTPAAVCGNGLRVAAKHVLDHGLVAVVGDVVRVATPSGVRPVTVRRGPDGRVVEATVDLGRPSSEPASVPFLAPAGAEGPAHRVEVDGTVVELAVVSMGNPHAVVLVDDVDEAPVARLGAALESHPAFPDRANVSFVQVVDPATIRLRVFERGVGETAACGSGACAAAVAATALGRTALGVDRPVEVRLPGGTLVIARTPDGHVTLTGPAVEVAHGRLDPAWLAAVGA